MGEDCTPRSFGLGRGEYREWAPNILVQLMPARCWRIASKILRRLSHGERHEGQADRHHRAKHDGAPLAPPRRYAPRSPAAHHSSSVDEASDRASRSTARRNLGDLIRENVSTSSSTEFILAMMLRTAGR